MAAPEYVPHPPTDKPRVYESPPWDGEAWLAFRAEARDAERA